MDIDGWLLAAAYVLLILLGGYFASAESAFAGAAKIKIRSLADEGDKRAVTVLSILDRFEKALTTLLIGNNLCHIGCASIATVLAYSVFDRLQSERGLTVSDSAKAAIATAVTTVIVYLVSEQLPKSYATAHSEKVALRYAPSLHFLMIVLTPLSILFGGVAHLSSKLVKAEEEPTVTEEELSSIIKTVEEEGVIDESQEGLLQSALEFSRTTVSHVMTLREDIVALDVSMSCAEAFAVISASSHSRLPVFDKTPDHVVGILMTRSFLIPYLAGKEFSLRELTAPAYFIPPDGVINDMLAGMSRTHNYMAIVRDSEGKTRGLVTVEDFLEELVGEIWDEEDVVNENFLKLGGNSFEVSAAYPLASLFHDMSYIPAEAPDEEKTVQTWVLENLGHAPAEDDSFRANDLLVTVTEVEENRLQRVQIRLLSAEELAEAVKAEEAEE